MDVKDKLKIAGDLATVVVTGAFGLDTVVQNLAVEHQQHIHDITSSNSIEIGYFRAMALSLSLLRPILRLIDTSTYKGSYCKVINKEAVEQAYKGSYCVKTGAASAFCFSLLSYTSINDAIADPKPYNLVRAAFDVGCVVFNAYLAYDAHKEIRAQQQLGSQKTI